MTILDIIFTVTLLAAPPPPTTPHVDAKPAPVIPDDPVSVDTRRPWKIVYVDKNTGQFEVRSSADIPAASRFVSGVPVVRVDMVEGPYQFCVMTSGPRGKFLSITTGLKGDRAKRDAGNPTKVPF